MKNAYFHSTACLSLLLVATLAPSAGSAQIDHQPLSRSASLTYEQVLDSALQNAPEQLAAESRRTQADRYSEFASSWFSGAPTLEASYIDDSPMSSVGLRELEAGLQFSLWRPGERGQTRELGQNYQLVFDAWQGNLELEVAGKLRKTLADIELADAMLEIENSAATLTEDLLSLTQSLYTAGEVSRLDVMQAETLHLEQQNKLFDAEAALVDAEREYEILTGLSMRPAALFREQQSDREEITPSHPLMHFIQANLQVARSRVNLVKREATGSPTLGFGVRRERGGRSDEYIDSLGLSFSIPLGKSAATGAAVSDARRDEAELEVALQRSRLMLDQRMHEAERQLFVARQQLTVSSNRAELAEQRLQMARAAYELGETDLLSVSIALQDSLRASQEFRELELREQRLISEYNQSLGIMP